MDLKSQLCRLAERVAVNDTPLPVTTWSEWTSDDWSPSPWHRPAFRLRDVTRLSQRATAVMREAA